ncbi:Wuschel homeobox protein [Rhynchospora pubera]|uniref:Wuschel homeobox protein n=1 Tax=Rhynchospora pubera TaxID=906938 RepID=A0AAV8HV89_9POAL|nr:Wuschel homeobox protein [Rhynchospora pubera]
MASSNRHWPSMFKSKPCSQTWPDISTPPPLSSACQKSPYTSAGCEERTPEPKPRWNPKPEQIRILEAIFNAGMVNPPREEIRKIRLQLQQYGQVGDANVFYWFQNRKSRTKNKQRHLISRANSRSSLGANISAIPTTGITKPNIGILSNVNTAGNNSNSITSPSTNITVPITMTTPTSSSSSSSERSSGSSKPLKPVHVPMSAPEPINMHYNFQGSMELSTLAEPLFLQSAHGYGFAIPEISGLIAAQDQVASVGLGLWNEPLGNGGAVTNNDEVGVKRKNNGEELHHGLGLSGELVHHEGYKSFFGREDGGESVKIELHRDCCFQPTDPVVASSTAAPADSVVTASVPAASGAADVTCATTTVVSCPVNVIQGIDNSNGEGRGEGRLTVFINDMACEVPPTPLNVKAVFGPNAVLFHPSGYPVPTDEFHNTLQPLQHGAFYYVIPV